MTMSMQTGQLHEIFSASTGVVLCDRDPAIRDDPRASYGDVLVEHYGRRRAFR